MHKLFTRMLPTLPALLAACTLAAPLLLSGQALYWGTPALQFVPWREFAFETVRSGRLPLWNPWLGMGAPLFANYQTALVYPPTWLLFVLSTLGGIEWHAWGQLLLVAFHWVLSGIGMARLAKHMGLGQLPQALAALAYGLGAYQVARAGFLSINAALAWLPWIIDSAGALASPRLRGDRHPRAVFIRFSLIAGLSLLAGHAQTVWYTCLLAFFWSGYWSWKDAHRHDMTVDHREGIRWRGRHLLRTWLTLGAGYIGAACLAAVQLLPTLEYLGQSQRAGAVDYNFAMTYSFWPWRFLTLLAPDLFGSPVSGDYWGYANYWEDALYIGLLPLLLALGATLSWLTARARRKPPPQIPPGDRLDAGILYEAVPFLLVLILVTFILALGKNTPVFPWLYRYLPTFDMFQAPTRISIWAVFALALLAGIGAQSWRRPTRRALYWTRLGTAGAAAVTIGAGLAWAMMGDVSPTFIRATALAGLWGVGAGILTLLAPTAVVEGGEENIQNHRLETITPWHWAAALFVVIDLVAAGWGLNPGVDTSFYSQPVAAAGYVRQELAGRRVYLSTDNEYTLKYERFLRFDSFDSGGDPFSMRTAMLPNLNMLDQVPSLSNFDPLVPGRYARWIEAMGAASSMVLEDLLDMSGVGMVQKVDPELPGGVTFESLPAGVGARARWVPCAFFMAADKQPIERVLAGVQNTDGQVLLEASDNDSTELPCLTPGAQGEVELVEEQASRVVLHTHSGASGWLLLSDTWYPGWLATVDGVSQPIYRANYLFRAVRMDEGEHEVVFVFRPASFLIGAGVNLVAVLVLLVLLVRARPRRSV